MAVNESPAPFENPDDVPATGEASGNEAADQPLPENATHADYAPAETAAAWADKSTGADADDGPLPVEDSADHRRDGSATVADENK
jgi:hypothetical protein